MKWDEVEIAMETQIHFFPRGFKKFFFVERVSKTLTTTHFHSFPLIFLFTFQFESHFPNFAIYATLNEEESSKCDTFNIFSLHLITFFN